MALRNGWKPTKKGWPDFICIGDDGKPFAVEVKPPTSKGYMKLLKREQVECIKWLEAAGIPCYVSDGTNMDRFEEAHHANPDRRRNPARNPRLRALG